MSETQLFLTLETLDFESDHVFEIHEHLQSTAHLMPVLTCFNWAKFGPNRAQTANFLSRNLRPQLIVWDHPFKTSACPRGGGVINLPNLPTDSSKKLPTVGDRGQKSVKICRRLKWIVVPNVMLHKVRFYLFKVTQRFIKTERFYR